MKTALLMMILLNANAFAQSGQLIENDPIDLNGTIKRESVEENIQIRRRQREGSKKYLGEQSFQSGGCTYLRMINMPDLNISNN